jgi:hypothetical protein
MKKSTAVLMLACLVAAGTSAAEKIDFSKLDLSKLPPPADKQGVTYAADIRPLFEGSCLRCHGMDRPKGGLRLDNLEAALKGGKDGKVINVGDSKGSLLTIAVAQLDEETAMPPKRGHGHGGPGGFGGAPNHPPDAPGGGDPPGPGPGGPGAGPGGRRGGFGPPPKPLTAEQVGLVRAWIDQGAK